MIRAFLARNASLLILPAALALFTLSVTILSEGFGIGLVSTSFVKVLGKTLCRCLVAIAMDLIRGYACVLSLGHMAFFALGGDLIGMWLMYARTEEIVIAARAGQALPVTPEAIRIGIGTQIFGVVGGSGFPAVWIFAHSLTAQLLLVILVPRRAGMHLRLARFRGPRHRRVPVDPGAGDDAGPCPLPVPERQRVARQHRPVGPAEHPRP